MVSTSGCATQQTCYPFLSIWYTFRCPVHYAFPFLKPWKAFTGLSHFVTKEFYSHIPKGKQSQIKLNTGWLTAVMGLQYLCQKKNLTHYHNIPRSSNAICFFLNVREAKRTSLFQNSYTVISLRCKPTHTTGSKHSWIHYYLFASQPALDFCTNSECSQDTEAVEALLNPTPS